MGASTGETGKGAGVCAKQDLCFVLLALYFTHRDKKSLTGCQALLSSGSVFIWL